MAVLGVGIDVVSVPRLETALARTEGLAARLFTQGELGAGGSERLAARFAAKEAAVKALGVRWAGNWHDVEVMTEDNGRPWLQVTGKLAQVAAEAGVASWHVSLSHDAGIATAIVIVESR